MQYTNSEHFSHVQSDKIGLLVTNLGTPDAPTKTALKKYLKQFLSDPRVVEVPRLLWWIILNCIILQIRPRRSAHAYQNVWTEAGSPLAINTRQQAEALQKHLRDTHGDAIVLEWGMRYGSPSIDGAIDKLLQQGVRKLLVLPLYPQYSASTTASTFDALAQDFMRRRWIPELRFITSYNKFEPYINALAQTIEAHWQIHGRPQMMVFSYHGVPIRYLHNGDPYHCQCHATSRLLAAALNLNDDQYLTTFQSRFGREPWLQPYTDETLKALPAKGITDLQVVCPGFSSDCLETIEEIGMENKDYFLEAGGEKFAYIPALNAQDCHIEALAALVGQHMAGWINIAAVNTESPAARNARFEQHTFNRKP